MARIEAPVKQDGQVTGVGGLVFTDGVATTDDPAIIAYCTGAGYTVDGTAQDVSVPPPPDSRTIEPVVALGSPLRDAAVDPQPVDFLAPSNAGQADPHGPRAVNPELHASQGVAPVVPGEVFDDPAEQEAKEAAAVDAAASPPIEKPAGNAPTSEWQKYAVARGMSPEEAASHSRSELRDLYAD